ncbi:MAG TPA: beta-ketoacyl synthase chain length factor, partial [Chitinophagaceae bacterium]|nr:beta-ketoacyl synthase chain length factor [Chitinophagaceae bacterium]
MYITASATISHQPTFRNNGFSSSLSELKSLSKLITPDYSLFIPAMERRRMSDVLKMSIACSMDCLEQAGLSQPDGIIVGTSMGCCVHTKNFLDKIIAANEGPLSPTSFIVSTHNTIAGQISLLLKNHGYNITHTQNSLSFEQGLIDGMLSIREGHNNILIGGADEQEDAIYNMGA